MESTMQVDPVDSLLSILAAATISDKGGCTPDAYLTESHIQQAVTRESASPPPLSHS